MLMSRSVPLIVNIHFGRAIVPPGMSWSNAIATNLIISITKCSEWHGLNPEVAFLIIILILLLIPFFIPQSTQFLRFEIMIKSRIKIMTYVD